VILSRRKEQRKKKACFGCSMLDAGYWLLVARCWLQNSAGGGRIKKACFLSPFNNIMIH
jgi:hypothetical protein